MNPDKLEQMLSAGTDNALLRFSLGAAYLRSRDYRRAAEHFARAVEFNPEYSAAWKNYGRCLQAAGDEKAGEVLRTALEVAQRNGDKQAEREVLVFLKRVESSH